MQREKDQSIAFQAVWRHRTSTVVILTKKKISRFSLKFSLRGTMSIFTIPLFTDLIANQRLNRVKAMEMKDRKDLKTPGRWQSCSNYKWNISYCFSWFSVMGEYTDFLLLFLVALCFETVSICTPDGPEIDAPPSASRVLGLLTVHCHSYSLKKPKNNTFWNISDFSKISY